MVAVHRHQLERRLEVLKRDLARTADEVAKLESVLAGPTLAERLGALSTGSVIRFTVQFNPGGRDYDYAAIKCGSRWFTTGPKSPKDYSSAEFALWLADKVYDETNVVVGYRTIEELMA